MEDVGLLVKDWSIACPALLSRLQNGNSKGNSLHNLMVGTYKNGEAYG